MRRGANLVRTMQAGLARCHSTCAWKGAHFYSLARVPVRSLHTLAGLAHNMEQRPKTAEQHAEMIRILAAERRRQKSVDLVRQRKARLAAQEAQSGGTTPRTPRTPRVRIRPDMRCAAR